MTVRVIRVNNAETVSEKEAAIAATTTAQADAPHGVAITTMNAGAPRTTTKQVVNPVTTAPIASP